MFVADSDGVLCERTRRWQTEMAPWVVYSTLSDSYSAPLDPSSLELDHVPNPWDSDMAEVPNDQMDNWPLWQTCCCSAVQSTNSPPINTKKTQECFSKTLERFEISSHNKYEPLDGTWPPPCTWHDLWKRRRCMSYLFFVAIVKSGCKCQAQSVFTIKVILWPRGLNRSSRHQNVSMFYHGVFTLSNCYN
jgi:hypothetical protein